jgi:hypothetical protein
VIQRQSVPEPDASVSCAPSTRQQPMLMWRPSYCFNSCNVIGEPSLGTGTVMQAPNQQLVVVAARGQLLLVVTPLEAADFLLVPDQLGFEVVLSS